MSGKSQFATNQSSSCRFEEKSKKVRQIVEWQLIYWHFFPCCHQAARDYLVEYPIRNNSYGTLHTSVVGLRFQAQRQHFSPDDGDMKLKCTASIGDIYWQVNEQSAEGLKSKRHSSSSNYQSFVHDDGNGPAGNDIVTFFIQCYINVVSDQFIRNNPI